MLDIHLCLHLSSLSVSPNIYFVHLYSFIYRYTDFVFETEVCNVVFLIYIYRHMKIFIVVLITYIFNMVHIFMIGF